MEISSHMSGSEPLSSRVSQALTLIATKAQDGLVLELQLNFLRLYRRYQEVGGGFQAESFAWSVVVAYRSGEQPAF